MSKELKKAWNLAQPGTLVTTDPAEAAAKGATLVDPARFAFLEGAGFFSEPEAGAATPASKLDIPPSPRATQPKPSRGARPFPATAAEGDPYGE